MLKRCKLSSSCSCNCKCTDFSSMSLNSSSMFARKNHDHTNNNKKMSNNPNMKAHLDQQTTHKLFLKYSIPSKMCKPVFKQLYLPTDNPIVTLSFRSPNRSPPAKSCKLNQTSSSILIIIIKNIISYFKINHGNRF